ncbi:MAG: hypothetical protein HY663_06280 [Chloroflexi bacterium]|nr:hypothetical protein [Chloroflexota bacterium]
MKRLLLFETASQLSNLLGKFAAGNSENIWVALSPEADYAAECVGLTYQQIEQFYDESELIALGMESYQTVGDFCDTLDQILKSYLSDIPEVKYLSAHQLFHAWKVLFDAILNRTLALKAAIENIKPDEIVSFKDLNIETKDGMGLSSGSAFRSLTPIVAEHYHIKSTQMPAARLDWQSLTSYRQRASWLLHQFPGGWRIINALALLTQERSMTNITDFDPRFKTGQPTLVVTESGYDVDYVMEKWRAENIGPVITLGDSFRAAKAPARERQTLKKKLAEIRDSSECQQRLAAYFSINGLDCYPIARSRLHYYLFHFLPQSLSRARFVQHTLEKLEKGVVLSILEPVTCAVARHLGIPSVIHQHGGLCGYAEAPIYEHMELYAGDYFFGYGEGTARFLEKPVASAHRSPAKHRAQPIAIGSSALDAIARTKESIANPLPGEVRKPRKVVYVPASLMGDQRYHSYHMCPDIWYWHHLRELVTIFGHFPEIQFTIKLYPKEFTKNPIDDWLRRNPLPNVTIVRDVPFIKFLPDADLFIMDSPTTTLVQAVTTDKKIILYVDRTFFRFEPHALELVKKRVVFSENKGQFLKDIARVLGEDDWSLPEPVNDEFLRSYGTYLNDGRSVERAVRALLALAEKNVR